MAHANKNKSKFAGLYHTNKISIHLSWQSLYIIILHYIIYFYLDLHYDTSNLVCIYSGCHLLRPLIYTFVSKNTTYSDTMKANIEKKQ